MRSGCVYLRDIPVGVIREEDYGFVFCYDKVYLSDPDAEPISRTLPLREDAYHSQTMFPFFDGLIPEGWLLDIAMDSWKIRANDRMALLLACCHDCIGAVHVEPIAEGGNDE